MKQTRLLNVPDEVACDNVFAVSIAPDSLLDAVMVNGLEVRVGGVVYLGRDGQGVSQLRLGRAPFYHFADRSAGALVSLQLWEIGEMPAPAARRDVYRVQFGPLTPGVAAYPTAAQAIVPVYGRPYVDVRGLAIGGAVDVVVNAIRYRGNGATGQAVVVASAQVTLAAGGSITPVPFAGTESADLVFGTSPSGLTAPGGGDCPCDELWIAAKVAVGGPTVRIDVSAHDAGGM